MDNGKGKVLKPSKEDIRLINERANMSKWFQRVYLKANCCELINDYNELMHEGNGEQVLN
jgi:hypothetical protein